MIRISRIISNTSNLLHFLLHYHIYGSVWGDEVIADMKMLEESPNSIGHDAG